MDHKTDSERAAFIEWMISDVLKSANRPVNDDMRKALREAAEQLWDSGKEMVVRGWKARASLAASAGSEPVAWRWKPSDVFDEWVMSDDSTKIHAAIVSGRDVFPLYTHPSPPEGAGWRPIATAPKDGTSFLGHWQGGKYDCAVRAVKFHNGKWWEPNEDYLVREPTHWMPLPAPPTSEAKEASK